MTTLVIGGDAAMLRRVAELVHGELASVAPSEVWPAGGGARAARARIVSITLTIRIQTASPRKPTNPTGVTLMTAEHDRDPSEPLRQCAVPHDREAGRQQEHHRRRARIGMKSLSQRAWSACARGRIDVIACVGERKRIDRCEIDRDQQIVSAHPRPRVVISRCIDFDSCRYNGQVIRASLREELEPHVELRPDLPGARDRPRRAARPGAARAVGRRRAHGAALDRPRPDRADGAASRATYLERRRGRGRLHPQEPLPLLRGAQREAFPLRRRRRRARHGPRAVHGAGARAVSRTRPSRTRARLNDLRPARPLPDEALGARIVPRRRGAGVPARSSTSMRATSSC